MNERFIFNKFAQGIELRINKMVKAKTILGGVLSIIMIISLSDMFFFSAQDILYHKNPNISIEQETIFQYPNITLDKYSMPISVALTTESNFGIYKPEYFRKRYFLMLIQSQGVLMISS